MRRGGGPQGGDSSGGDREGQVPGMVPGRRCLEGDFAQDFAGFADGFHDGFGVVSQVSQCDFAVNFTVVSQDFAVLSQAGSHVLLM